MYLSDLREKTWRGQLGRALMGKIPGGRAFGYDVVTTTDSAAESGRGHRKVNQAEATVVKRIFKEFAGGTSPRALALAPDAGQRWTADTLPAARAGHSERRLHPLCSRTDRNGSALPG